MSSSCEPCRDTVTASRDGSGDRSGGRCREPHPRPQPRPKPLPHRHPPTATQAEAATAPAPAPATAAEAEAAAPLAAGLAAELRPRHKEHRTLIEPRCRLGCKTATPPAITAATCVRLAVRPTSIRATLRSVPRGTTVLTRCTQDGHMRQQRSLTEQHGASHHETDVSASTMCRRCFGKESVPSLGQKAPQ